MCMTASGYKCSGAKNSGPYTVTVSFLYAEPSPLCVCVCVFACVCMYVCVYQVYVRVFWGLKIHILLLAYPSTD